MEREVSPPLVQAPDPGIVVLGTDYTEYFLSLADRQESEKVTFEWPSWVGGAANALGMTSL